MAGSGLSAKATLVVGGVFLLILISVFHSKTPSPSVPSSPAGSPPSSSSVVTPSSPVPPNQATLLQRFDEACQSYDAAPNEIRKSAVFRSTAAFYSQVGRVERWLGTIKRISTNQGGPNATIVITMGTSDIYDRDVPIDTRVYNAAADLQEGQSVVFSGRNLSDFNLTERGKVCHPDFGLHLTFLQAAH